MQVNWTKVMDGARQHGARGNDPEYLVKALSTAQIKQIVAQDAASDILKNGAVKLDGSDQNISAPLTAFAGGKNNTNGIV